MGYKIIKNSFLILGMITLLMFTILFGIAGFYTGWDYYLQQSSNIIFKYPLLIAFIFASLSYLILTILLVLFTIFLIIEKIILYKDPKEFKEITSKNGEVLCIPTHYKFNRIQGVSIGIIEAIWRFTICVSLVFFIIWLILNIISKTMLMGSNVNIPVLVQIFIGSGSIIAIVALILLISLIVIYFIKNYKNEYLNIKNNWPKDLNP